jgi:hypothetical protein
LLLGPGAGLGAGIGSSTSLAYLLFNIIASYCLFLISAYVPACGISSAKA